MTAEEQEYLNSLLAKQEQFFLARQLRLLETLAGGVAHEFNNLLAGLSGYTQMILENPADTELVKRGLTTCLGAIKRGGEIVTRLGHFARLDRPEWEVDDLQPVVNDAIELCRVDCEHEGIVIETDFGETPPVRFDPSLLTVALLDILQNAIEALHENQERVRVITVITRLEDDEAVIRIRDSGPGMTPRELESALDPFFTTRGVLARGRRPLAKGLGLSVAQGILRNLGGRLTVEAAPGEGVEVRLSLPAVKPLFVGQKGRVLVVDDEAIIRKIFTRFLTKANYDVTSVASASLALELLSEGEYDLILLDQMMPGMSGMEMLEQLVAAENGRALPPVVMVTAAYSPKLARRALELGARACVAKPINHDKIIYLVNTYTGVMPTASLTRPRTRPERSPPKERVLVVDADPLTRDILDLLLRRSGYLALTLGSGTQAEDATESEYYDLILIDVLLHDKPGIEVVRRIRINNPYTPILVTTSKVSRRTLREALDAGATRAIRKPVDAQSLVAEIEHLVGIFKERAPAPPSHDR